MTLSPSDQAPATVSGVVVAWRATRGLLHVLLGLGITTLVFPWLSYARRAPIVSWWARGFISALGLQVRVTGAWPTERGRYLMASNHVTWLDIFVIHAVKPVRFVSKSEVRGWPIAGFLASRAGTLFVDRARKRDTFDIGAQMLEIMENGEAIGIFPEGTTSDGQVLLPFFSPLLQPAVRCEATLVPAGLRYRRADGSLNTDLAFIGEQTFLESVKVTLRQPRTHAEVRFGELIPATGLHRRELTRRLETAIAELLGLKVDPAWLAPGTDAPPAGSTPVHASTRRSASSGQEAAEPSEGSGA